MNTKEIIKKDIETEIELFKIFALFLVGLSTGVSGLLLNKDISENTMAFGLLIIGLFFLIFVTIIFVRSFFKIRRLRKELKK